MVTIALAGVPNAGKTTLFNALTGDRQPVGNWPGATVARLEGVWRRDASVRILDLPGVCSLSPYTPEEAITRRVLTGERPDAILNLVDGASLERSLYLTTQLLELGLPMVVAVNRLDLLEKRGQALDLDLLSARLGCPAVAISAARGTGVHQAAELAAQAARTGMPPKPFPLFAHRVEQALSDIGVLAHDYLPQTGRRWYLVKLFEGDPPVQKALGVGLALRQRMDLVVSACEEAVHDDREELIAAGRYAFAGQLARRCLTRGRESPSLTARMDKLLLHPLLSLPLFLGTVLGTFWLAVHWVGGWTDQWMAAFFQRA